MSHHFLRNGRAARPLALVVALCLGASVASIVTGVGPALSAPVADCTEAFPVADLVAGDPVDGLTVTTGTVPQSFTGQVLGTLDDGIAPGVDMVLVKVDPTGLNIDTDEVKGIWQGMSGSPVYASDGRLIGAVAYGLSSQQSWVAGVTPFEEMDDYLGTDQSFGRVALDRRTAARVATAAGVTSAQAARGFVQLPSPFAVSGAPARFLHPTAREVKAHPWLRTDSYAAGRASISSGVDADTIVAGGNLAAGVSYGDIVMAGVGTATSVCDGQVIGFGHPMTFTGESALALHPAETLYVQGDAPSFKVANIGAPVGTIFGDHLTGLTGRFGAAPATTTVTSTVSWGPRHRTGSSYVAERDSYDLAFATYLQSAVNHQRVIDAQTVGSEVLTWTVTGTDAAATPFSLSWTDRYAADYDLSDEIGMYVGSMVEGIAALPGVTVDTIAVDGAADATTAHYRLARVEQQTGGTWTKVSQRRPVFARAGSKLKVRAVLRDGREVIRVPFTFDVPRKAAGQIAALGLAGGQSTFVNYGDSVADVRKALRSGVRSDTIRAQFGKVTNADVTDYDDEGDYEEGFYFRGGTQPKRPQPVKFLHTQVTAPAAAVMSGSALIMVVIR